MLTFKPSFYEINKRFEISYTNIVKPVLIAVFRFCMTALLYTYRKA